MHFFLEITVRFFFKLGAALIPIGLFGLFEAFENQPSLLPLNNKNPLIFNASLILYGIVSFYTPNWVVQFATKKERRYNNLERRVYFDDPSFLNRLYWMFRYEAYKVEKHVQVGKAKAEIFAYKKLNFANLFSYFVCFYIYYFEDGCDVPFDVFEDRQIESIQHAKNFMCSSKQTSFTKPYTVTFFVSPTGFENSMKVYIREFDQSSEKTVFLMDLKNERIIGSEKKIVRGKMLINYIEDTLRLFLRIMRRDLGQFEYPGWYPIESSI